MEGTAATEVAGVLPMLDEAVGVTESMVATLAHEGRYDHPTRCGQPLTVGPGRIALRIAPQRVVGAVTDDDTRGGPAEASMVGLVDRRGAALHRAFVTGDSDRMVVRALGHLAPADESRELLFGAALSSPTPASPTPLLEPSPVDEILSRDGRDRLQQLCELDADRYQKISTEWVPRIFEYLCDSGTPVGFAVFNTGVMQACYGRIHAALREGPGLLTGFADAAVQIDLAHVDGCAVVRSDGAHGLDSAIELYDAGGSCAAMLTQFGTPDRATRMEWEAVARSVCEAS